MCFGITRVTVTNSDGDVSVIDCDEGCSAPPDRITPWNRVRIRVKVLSLNLPLSESLIGRSYVDVCCSAGARNKSMVRNRSVVLPSHGTGWDRPMAQLPNSMACQVCSDWNGATVRCISRWR